MSSASRRRGLGLALVSTLAMAVFWAPAFEHPWATGYGDWQWFHHMWEAGRTALVRWGEPPLFDPHHCGGVPLWGNPQAQVYSPTWLLTGALFGTALGHKLYLVLHAVAGHAGLYVLSRRVFGLTSLGAFVAATVWAASGFFAWHGAGGHATFISFYWAPWLLLAWRAAARDVRYAALVGLLMALVVAEGGHYPFPYFVLWLALDLAWRVLRAPRAAWPALRGALVSGALGGLVASYRVLPILFTVLAHPHPVPDDDAMTPSEILTMLTARAPPPAWPHRWVWNEYGGFVGWTVLGLAAVGVALAIVASLRRRPGRRPLVREPGFLLFGLVAFFLLTQGAASAHHPWPWLQELPFYRSIHVPSRFRVLFTLYLAVLSGAALDALRLALVRARWPRALGGLREALPWALVAALVVDLYVVNLATNDRWDGPELDTAPVEARFHFVNDRYRYLLDYATYPHRHVGTRECYDPVPWVLSPSLWTGEALVARVEPESAGRVLDADRTSRTLWAQVELTAPGRVLFDQTTLPGWEAEGGTLTEARGLVAVDVPAAGSRRVLVRYAPRDVPWVLALSGVGLAASALVWRAPWRARRARRAA